MEKIHIYAINLSPCEQDDSVLIQKSSVIKSIIEEYKKKSSNAYEVDEDEITMFSFCPLDNSGYIAYVEDFVNKEAKKPCVLIFKNLLDIANVPKTACGRLKHMLHREEILAIYFYDYSTVYTADTYLNKLIEIFNIDIESTGENKRRSLHPESLKKEIRRLRIIEPPVLYSDMEKVTGISQSSLRSIVCPPNTQGSRGPNGRHITEEEKEKLLTLMEEDKKKVLNSVEVFKEIYIK